MIMLARVFLVVTALLVGACAHPINIVPKVDFSTSDSALVQKSVAYVITQADKDREVITEGGGGDLISYFPYRDLESGIFQALSAVFSRATLIRGVGDDLALSKNKVSLVFIPKITTTSSSDGLFTWPPTQFAITIEYLVQDLAGSPVYKNLVLGTGRATFTEFSGAGDFGLAGRRAAEDVLKKLKDQISSAKELR
jgi:hypothetical protein